ncbi:hypothetical protein A2U01_0045335 [Trifolium medium]|uniref:Uncharacterized protein n=1 Tax=Trifolium medium TaxID=97028 RepID=A0A392QJX0_9FABA|nr:hypothetical protein [Trifolium medium]
MKCQNSRQAQPDTRWAQLIEEKGENRASFALGAAHLAPGAAAAPRANPSAPGADQQHKTRAARKVHRARRQRQGRICSF